MAQRNSNLRSIPPTSNEVSWPWAAERLEFTTGDNPDLQRFGQYDAMGKLTSEINTGLVRDITRDMSDEELLEDTVIFNTEKQDSIKGILEDSDVNRIFFSKANIEALQQLIRYRVYQSNNEAIISIQSEEQLFIIMRSILLQYGNMVTPEPVEEVKRLNNILVNKITNKMNSEVAGYVGYIVDLEKNVELMPRPEYLNKNNFTYDMTNI
jgi:hypothetical protein